MISIKNMRLKKLLGPSIGQMIFSNNYLAVLFSGDARPQVLRDDLCGEVRVHDVRCGGVLHCDEEVAAEHDDGDDDRCPNRRLPLYSPKEKVQQQKTVLQYK